jgi:carbonic anhydrase/acetyltransferase-like protein (isoleucine patch superfamily)
VVSAPGGLGFILPDPRDGVGCEDPWMSSSTPTGPAGPLVRLGEDSPSVDPSAWVAPTARVIGRATLGPSASVWYGAVVRADRERIDIGPESNVQDNAVLHADPGRPVRLGARVTVGHAAVVHGAVVEDDVLVGMGCVVLNGARIGAGSVVGAGAVVAEGTEVPAHSLVLGVPGRVRGQVPDERVEDAAANARTYVELAERHRAAG